MSVIRRISMAVLLIGITCSTHLPSVVAADQPLSVDKALEEYERFFSPVLSAMGSLRDAQADHSERRQVLTDSERNLQDAETALLADRSRFAGVVVSAYKDRGSSSTDSLRSTESSVALISGRLRAAERLRSDALKARDTASDKSRFSGERLERATENVAEAERNLQESERELHRLVSSHAPTLPGYAYAAYVRASRQLDLDFPDCPLPPALFVGMGRILSNHGAADNATVSPSGRSSQDLLGLVGEPTPDTDHGRLDGNPEKDLRVGPMQLLPSQWSGSTNSETVAPLTPDWLYASSVVAGAVLCSGSNDLATDSGLHRALVTFTDNASLARAIMGSARHVSRTTGLNLGELPADPRQQSALDRLAVASDIDLLGVAPVDALLAWSRNRLGTPYSQCLGLEVRPEDPECPPGTNRFGQGFFDCSGFVSAAFGALGIEVPTTTDAMFRDDTFSRFFVSDQFDVSDDRAGDVLLMDGHVALSAGNGVIIHASGGQLIEESIPSWVRIGVLGVYRLLS
jgi:cell wall-associated NlpC family hydrolase